MFLRIFKTRIYSSCGTDEFSLQLWKLFGFVQHCASFLDIIVDGQRVLFTFINFFCDKAFFAKMFHFQTFLMLPIGKNRFSSLMGIVSVRVFYGTVFSMNFCIFNELSFLNLEGGLVFFQFLSSILWKYFYKLNAFQHF